MCVYPLPIVLLLKGTHFNEIPRGYKMLDVSWLILWTNVNSVVSV